MKKLFALLTILIMCSSVFAQNTITVDQDGAGTAWQHPNINVATLHQIGSDNQIIVDQSAATLWNQAKGIQEGTNLDAFINQTAGGYNNLDRLLHSSSNGLVDLDQVAGGNNFATIWSQNGDNNNIIIDQLAGTDNSAKYTGYGSDFIFDVKQDGALSNTVTGQGSKARQGNWGVNYTGNTVVGAVELQWGYSGVDYLTPATQTSTTSYNYLSLDQYDGSDNIVGLYQTATDFNSASIIQQGSDNLLSIYQTNANGSNTAVTDQQGSLNVTRIYQETFTGPGVITVNQN